jgi:pyruvate,water dikinase
VSEVEEATMPPAEQPETRQILGGPIEDFPFQFDRPEDANETWERDDMHMPFALTPLAEDFIRHMVGASFNPYYEQFGAPQRNYAGIWNGWAYFSFRRNVTADEADAAGARWTEVHRSRIALTTAFWRDEAMPELRAMYAWIEAVPVDELAGPELADAWLTAWAHGLRAWVLHFISIMGPYQVLDDLVDAYTAAMGPGRDAEALGLIGGTWHELEDVEEGVEHLAQMAADLALADRLQAIVDAGEVDAAIPPDQLRAAIGDAAFSDALASFLDRHGHLGQNHDDLRLAHWSAAPRLLLGQVLGRIRQPPQPVRDRVAALSLRAAELAAAVRATLADRPDELARFETVLAQAREIGYLTEGHNYWIDRLSHARIRDLATRVGARMVRDGILAEPGDIFFLHRDEVAEALRDGASRASLVAERKAAHARNERLSAPYYLGKPPEQRSGGDRFDGPRVASTEANLLRGAGASAGVVRGPARVVRSQDDFDQIRPGDIIVCPASNPSWVPVFTIAGGLVTNTGGVLSHAAVVAREFGLPAVVGTGDATTRIANGRLVEIDGTAGTVRLL